MRIIWINFFDKYHASVYMLNDIIGMKNGNSGGKKLKNQINFNNFIEILTLNFIYEFWKKNFEPTGI